MRELIIYVYIFIMLFSRNSDNNVAQYQDSFVEVNQIEE